MTDYLKSSGLRLSPDEIEEISQWGRKTSETIPLQPAKRPVNLHLLRILQFTAVKIGRKHKAHRQQLQQSKPWRNSEKGRSKGRRKGRFDKMGQEESHMIDEDEPTRTLDSRTLESVATFIKNGHARKIVVMTGAGISTSAGIPDFRSPDTGIYANLAQLNLPYAEAVFDISYFRNNPLPFYTLAQELYPGKYRPTITHSFINLLYQKGLLLKLFTQNIDCLEREAGVPGDVIVEAHGSFARQSCVECKHPYPQDLMQKAIHEKSVPTCLECNGLVKPEIVFFGEQLPTEFFANRGLPVEADLCIVMGTSLSVQPFASLPEFCSQGTPRVLINQERVGTMGSRSDDVLILGDCDGGVRKLAEACGWLEELNELWAKTAPKATGKEKEVANKTQDERLEDEIEKLTKEVEESLKLGKNQQKWLENHLDEKIARQKEDENEVATDSASAPAEPEKVLRPGETNSPGDSDGGGLSHVFPFLSKKSSR
ncbi:NAD-dependent deacetylase sirtuin-2 [Lojkania enalia]|uniref:NAD-dependent deacetylase sirtuin-2 n=1 Tax=Lojkania enalia TaxID=147567 RepID=A0A9P4K2M1_9PLEO|nr:NAD-dependent deacetylase sirtuin-2 [Didymosphaeria enalia]